MATAAVPPVPSDNPLSSPKKTSVAPVKTSPAKATPLAKGTAPLASPVVGGVVVTAQPALNNLLPADGQMNDGEEQEQLPHHTGGFWNEPWVQNVLPFATSMLLHVVIIGIGIALFGVVQKVTKAANRDQVIVPEAKSPDKAAIPGGIPHPGLNADPTRDAAQDAIKDSANDGFTSNANSSVAAALGGGTGDSEASPFAGSNPSNGKGSAGLGGAGNAFGSGSGGGTAPWGVPGGGGGLGPKSNFMGTGGNARDIVYLCDASGSMLSVFGNLKMQLKESIQKLDLTSGQKFNVIFFSDDNCFALFKDGLQIATPDNKQKAMDFVDNAVSTGGTQPLPAIKEALKEKPQLLYVLTDGFDQIANFDDVTNAFKAGNTDGKMHINCIFLQADEDPKLEQVLKQIATQGHGEFKKILKSEM